VRVGAGHGVAEGVGALPVALLRGVGQFVLLGMPELMCTPPLPASRLRVKPRKTTPSPSPNTICVPYQKALSLRQP
jgi:hypothetical protein